MTEQQRAFNPDRAAMEAVSSIQAIMAIGKFGAQKSAQIQDIIADTIRAALSHAEWEAQPDYVLDALDNLIHDNYERSYRGAKNRQDDAELIRCALRRSHPAPQVAVPEKVRELIGAVRSVNRSRQHSIHIEGDDEPCFWQRAEWVRYVLELADEAEQTITAAPTAPAGEPECCRSQPCKRPGTGPCDMPAAQQPVSDPDGLPESPRPMSAAPRDGSMIRLLVQFTENGVNDGFDSGPAWTIGANTYDDSGDDEWHIAGWDWQQDCFTAGEGEPLGWLPMLSAPAPDEREIAAKAINDAAQYAQDWIEKQGAVTPESAAALDAVQAYSNSLEKKS
ncbi:hypothetical protein [Alloalcanivorax venustensis]|jgi:hypothetical protein|uniref:hypothetical protein n=1 Tax=Alloalcanivorax venustensis TaxID=172371 RepID=UPI0039E5CB9F